MLTLAAGFGGCTLSEEQKEEAKQYEQQAEKNAVEYIKEKYDIDADVVASNYNKTGMFGDAVSTYVTVEMEYEDESFDVYILGDKAWKDAKENYKELTCDNYQYDIIYKDVKAYLEKETKVNLEECLIRYNSTEVSGLENMTNIYYDGNVEVFLDKENVYAVLVTTDTKVGTFDSVDMGDGSLYTYSYEEDYYEEYGHTVKNGYVHLDALWLNWSAKVQYGKAETGEYKKEEFGLGYLVYDKACDVNVSKTSVDEKDWRENGFKKAETISDAYKIKGDEQNIYVFLEMDEEDSIGIAYDKNGKMSYEKLIQNNEEIQKKYVGGYWKWIVMAVR